MTLYDSIFVRKSTRKYQQQALPPRQLSQIQAFVKDAKPLFPNIRTRIDLVNASEVKGMVSAKAPHYLLIYSEKADGYLTNAGFLLQQADLFAASLGLSSCWLGMAKAVEPAKDGLHFVIMLALGAAQGDPYRADASEFSRKPLSEISSGQDERLEAARLAPSATNSQPWYFACAEEGMYVYRQKLGALKAVMYEAMNQIDMGIALCHLWLAGERAGRTFAFEPGAQPNAPRVDGYACVGRVCG